MVKTELTNKQQRFCQEYMIDLNATQAALRAGYCANSVNKVGPANLVKIGIKREIARLKAATSKKIGVTAEYVLNKLKTIAETTERSHPAVSVRAYELLGKHKGIFEADNAQKALVVREYTIKELKVLFLEGEQRDKRIVDAGSGIVK